MMSATVHVLLVKEVDEIHQQFLTRGTSETLWMPTRVSTSPPSMYNDITRMNLLSTLEGVAK